MNSNKDIVVEQGFKKSITEVWNAITEQPQMIQWFFENIPEFKAEQNFETSFQVKSGDRIFTHIWKIIEVIPFKKIVYDWTYEEYPGQAIVRFELFNKENGTRLKLTNEGLDSFPNDIPEFKAESCQEGWNYFINRRLKNYLK